MRTAPRPRTITEAPKTKISETFRRIAAVASDKLTVVHAHVRKGVAASGRTLVIAACVAGSIGLARLVEAHVKKSPSFATKSIEIQGLSHLSRDVVLAAAGLQEGQNVFRVSPNEAEERLEHHPWIASADVERRLPATYRITVHEHVPVAMVSLGSTYLVAEDGTVFKRVAPTDPTDLPLVTGLDRERFVSDRAYRASAVLQAVALLRAYRDAGLSRQAIAELHFTETGEVDLIAGQGDVHVSLGHAPFREKLSRLQQVFSRVEREHLDVTEIFLDHERRHDRVTVRLRSPQDATEALAAATARPR